YTVAVFAAIRVGAIVTPSSPEYGLEEMSYILTASESDLVYADKASWDVVCTSAEKVGLTEGKVVLVGSEAETRSQPEKANIQDLIRQAKAKGEEGQLWPLELGEGQTNKDVLGYLSFTSGTTSRPKGVGPQHAPSSLDSFVNISVA